MVNPIETLVTHRLVTYVLYITAVTLNNVDDVFSVTGQVRFDGERYTGR